LAVKIAIIGGKDAIMAFKAIGIDTFPVPLREDIEGLTQATLKKLIQEGYGIIFVTEDIAKRIESIMNEVKERPIPSIVVIPGTKPKEGFASARIRAIVRKSLGIDLLGKK